MSSQATNAFAHSLVIGADALSVAVGAAMITVAMTTIANSLMETADEPGELCIVKEVDEFCGQMSFDSTGDYACVEVQGADGQWRWQCA